MAFDRVGQLLDVEQVGAGPGQVRVPSQPVRRGVPEEGPGQEETVDRVGQVHEVFAVVDAALLEGQVEGRHQQTDPAAQLGGKALLFENVEGSDIPVAINTFGSYWRVNQALGTDNLEALAVRVGQLVKPEIPTTLIEKMKKLLRDIQSGRFADEWMAECEAGKPHFKKLEEKGLEHPIETVGAQLRAMMPWLKQRALVNRATN